MADPTGWFDQAQAPATGKARFETEDRGRLVAIVRAEEGWDHARLAGAAGVTERAVAEVARMTQPAIARFEAGGTVPTLPVLDRLAHALGAELVVRSTPRSSAA